MEVLKFIKKKGKVYTREIQEKFLSNYYNTHKILVHLEKKGKISHTLDRKIGFFYYI
jgi:hypothetical protein